MDDSKVVHDVLGLRADQSISDEGRGNPTYGVYEEAREDGIPQSSLRLALFVFVGSIYLLEIT